MANKITYGLSNVVVWPITATTDGKPTYGTQIKMPGAVEMSIEAQGSSDPYYADNSIYYQGVSNTGYSGTLKIADIPVEFLTKVLNEINDKNGAQIESADVAPSEFAIAFEFNGDQHKRRHLLWRCIATRPNVESSTKEASITPNTPELSFTCMPRLDNSHVKARAEEGDAAYSSWFGEKPYEFADGK